MNRVEFDEACEAINDCDCADDLYSYLCDNNWESSIEEYLYSKNQLDDSIIESIYNDIRLGYVSNISELRSKVDEAEGLLDADEWFVQDDYEPFGYDTATYNLRWLKETAIQYLKENELNDSEDDSEEEISSKSNLDIFNNDDYDYSKDFQILIGG